MSAGFPPGFPPAGAPGSAPGFAPQGFAPGAPAYPQATAPAADFVLDIPPDPTWQPMESSDTLENDGFYQCRIKSEKVRTDDGAPQIIMTLEIQDPDARGKLIARFMQDPRHTRGDTWWLWRGLMRSISGTVQGGQQGFRYAPGALTGQICYVKTGAYNDGKGNMRTGVDAWSTEDEWREAYNRGGHRWAAKVRVAQSPGVGALPGGAGGLPGAPSAGLPGAPTMPGLPGAPAGMPGVPTPGAAPMQPPAPATNPFAAAPAAAPPAPAAGFAPPPAAAPPTGFGFAPPPPAAAAPPPAPIPFPPPAGNGVPQPTAAGVAMAFPGPGPQR